MSRSRYHRRPLAPRSLAEALEPRCLLSAAPASWIAASPAVFTADHTAWFVATANNTQWIERVSPDGTFAAVTSPQSEPLAHLTADGNDLWFTQGAAELEHLHNHSASLVQVNGVSSITALAASPDGTLWFAGETPQQTGLLGAIAPDGTVSAEVLPSVPVTLSVDTEAFSTAFVTGEASVSNNAVTSDGVMVFSAATLSATGSTDHAVTGSPGGAFISRAIPYPAAATAFSLSAPGAHASVGAAVPDLKHPSLASPVPHLPVVAGATSSDDPGVFDGEFGILASAALPPRLPVSPSDHGADDEYASAPPRHPVSSVPPLPPSLGLPRLAAVSALPAPVVPASVAEGASAVRSLPTAGNAPVQQLAAVAPVSEKSHPRAVTKWSTLAVTLFAATALHFTPRSRIRTLR